MPKRTKEKENPSIGFALFKLYYLKLFFISCIVLLASYLIKYFNNKKSKNNFNSNLSK